MESGCHFFLLPRSNPLVLFDNVLPLVRHPTWFSDQINLSPPFTTLLQKLAFLDENGLGHAILIFKLGRLEELR